MKAEQAGSDRAVLQGCMFLVCDPGYVNIILGAISAALYWTQEKEGEKTKENYGLFFLFNVLENFAFPLGNELFLSLCAAAV